MPHNVSIIIPVVRPDKARRCMDAVQKYAPDAEIVSQEDINRIGCPKMMADLAGRARNELVIFLGDDTIPREGFLEAALATMGTFPGGWGLVGLNTIGGQQNAHWMCHKNMLPLLGGEFFCTEYWHYFCDNELREIAEQHGRWAWCEDAVVEHDHPTAGEEADRYHEITLRSAWAHDRRTYIRRKRKRKGELLAIGFPLVDSTVPVSFFLSFACMDKPDQYRLLVPEWVHGRWFGSLADARNNLVDQAMMDGASWLFMLDTDQTYPVDALTKLLAHRKDVCGVQVHRAWPPYDPVMLRGEPDRYLRISDEEMYSGELIEVDATGTGALLLRMAMFDDLEPPWFEVKITEAGRPLGEDISMCHKARKAGFEVWVDTSVEVGHLRTINIGRAIYEMFKAAGKWRAAQTQ